jgi:hypothetical protein
VLSSEELVRAGVRALNERDADAFSKLVTDDFQWVTHSAAGIETRTYRGKAAISRYFQDAKTSGRTLRYG